MYAVVRTGGKQYKVSPGDVVDVERIPDVKKGDEIILNDVLLFRDEGVFEPNPKGVVVRALVEGEFKGKKIIVFKYKRRKNYQRKKGHRQIYTRLKILSIDREEGNGS